MLTGQEVWQRLQEANQNGAMRYVATGSASANHYGVLSGGERLSLYVTSLEAVSNLLEVKSTRVFPNIELVEVKSELVYFDARRANREVWASPIQTWLELVSGNAREQDAANLLQQQLL